MVFTTKLQAEPTFSHITQQLQIIIVLSTSLSTHGGLVGFGGGEMVGWG